MNFTLSIKGRQTHVSFFYATLIETTLDIAQHMQLDLSQPSEKQQHPASPDSIKTI